LETGKAKSPGRKGEKIPLFSFKIKTSPMRIMKLFLCQSPVQNIPINSKVKFQLVIMRILLIQLANVWLRRRNPVYKIKSLQESESSLTAALILSNGIEEKERFATTFPFLS
jgi:hypothetical protein